MSPSVRAVVTSPQFVYAVGVLGGAMMGAGTTYLVVSKKLEAKYAAIADQEIAEARELYKERYKEAQVSALETLSEKYAEEPEPEVQPEERASMAQEAARIAEESGYVNYSSPSTAPEQDEEERVEVVGSIRRSVWDDHAIIETGEFDPVAEETKKERSLPYILEHDEFYENPFEHVQVTLTYFEEDDVLVDEKDRPIPDKDRVVGAGNLRFGYGTDQANVVLIHNPVIGVDYEVTRDKGSYSKEILNYEPKDRKRSTGKFRDSDD